MTTGMLWFDNDKQVDLSTKISRAADYYQKKYGRRPDLCFVHPSMIGGSLRTEGIEVKPTRQVLPNHLWLGVQEIPTPN